MAKPTNPKLGLERISDLLRLIGFDRKALQIIQVVGTNGKGSTVAFMEAVLQHNGISTGLFTSPHLCTARERIRINGHMVDKRDFVAAAQFVLEKSKSLADEASFFECMLAMAMRLFQKARVRVAILEAGLGGRLDATTATKPDLLGVSMIDLDHQNILGMTITEIAAEKIAAARPGETVITVSQVSEVADVLSLAQPRVGFHFLRAPACELPLGLYGEHQKANAGLALALVEELGIKTVPKKTSSGLLAVNWPGRFEFIDGPSTIVLDGAHNPSGMLALMDCLKSHPQVSGRPLIVIYGSLHGVGVEEKVKILLNSGLDIVHVFLHQPKNGRAMLLSELRTLFVTHGFVEQKLHELTSWSEVMDKARQEAAAVVVCGSLYTVGEIRGELLSIDMDQKTPDF